MDVKKKITAAFGPEAPSGYIYGFILWMIEAGSIESDTIPPGEIGVDEVDQDRVYEFIMADETLRDEIETLAYSAVDKATILLLARVRHEMREFGSDDSAQRFGTEVAAVMLPLGGDSMSEFGMAGITLERIAKDSEAGSVFSRAGLTITVDPTPLSNGSYAPTGGRLE